MIAKGSIEQDEHLLSQSQKRESPNTLCFSPPSLELSIIIPVRDEVGNVVPLSQEIDEALASSDLSWECIWVDDGSIDRTRQELSQVCREGSPHRYFSHVRSYGQSAALRTGFQQARGALLAMLDGDGQSDPKFLPTLIQELKEHEADMVNGWREDRQESWTRRLVSYFGNMFRNMLMREHTRDVGCSLRVFRRECLEHLFLFDGFHRFIPSLACLNGYHKIREVAVQHRPRQKGKSKYTISNRLIAVILDTLAIWWMKKRLVYPLLEGKREQQAKEEKEKC